MAGGLTYQEAYQWGYGELTRAGIAEARLDARLLLEWCCGTDHNTFFAHGERLVTEEENRRYAQCIAGRAAHIPLQYITGEQEFMGLTYEVNKNVLIPRQDTEVLVEEVMRYLHDGMRILDVCTGSGCILISLLYYSNDCTGVGTDISGDALQIAGKNADRILSSRTQRKPEAVFVQGDLFEGLDADDKFDVIVSNPPYIRTDVIDSLMPEVRDHEPRIALDGREDGLFYYRRIITEAGRFLSGGGMLFLEIGYDQGESVRELMQAAGYGEIEVVKDFAGLDRVVLGGKHV